MPCTNEEGKNTLPGQVLVACVRDKNMTQFLPDFWDNRLRMLKQQHRNKRSVSMWHEESGYFHYNHFQPTAWNSFLFRTSMLDIANQASILIQTTCFSIFSYPDILVGLYYSQERLG